MSKEVAWYDLSCAPKLAERDGHESIRGYLQNECKFIFVQIEVSVEAKLRTGEEYQILGIYLNSPCIIKKRKT